MSIFYMKQGDTSPSLRTTLKDSSATPVNITGATVNMHMYTQDKVTVVIDAEMSISDAAGGVVTYDWQAGETDNSGWYWVEFEVTYSDATVETFPNSGYEAVKITPQLA